MGTGESDFRIDWDTFRGDPFRRAFWLAQERAVLDAWLGRLGPAARDFRAAFAAAGCREEIDLSIPSTVAAWYNSYSVKNGFINRLAYGENSLRDRRTLFLYRCHEMVHALQQARCAAPHAVPSNRRSPVVLCPRDRLRLRRLMEEDAYTKQAVFHDLLLHAEKALAAGADSGLEKLASGHPELARLVRIEHERLRRWMGEHADVMERADALYLKEYEDTWAERSRYPDAARPVFARLDAEDIAALGVNFGPDIFTGGDGALAPARPGPPDLSAASEAALRRLNETLGIADEDSLPTLRGALAGLGMTPASYLESCRANALPRKTGPGAANSLATGPEPA